MAKGKLPITGRIDLECNTLSLELLARGMMREISTTGIIKLEDERKAKVLIKITQVVHPDTIYSNSTFKVRTDLQNPAGYTRMMSWLQNYLVEKNMWVIFGHTDGEIKVPLMFVYLSELDIFIYTQKLISDDKEQWKWNVPVNLN